MNGFLTTLRIDSRHASYPFCHLRWVFCAVSQTKKKLKRLFADPNIAQADGFGARDLDRQPKDVDLSGTVAPAHERSPSSHDSGARERVVPAREQTDRSPISFAPARSTPTLSALNSRHLEGTDAVRRPNTPASQPQPLSAAPRPPVPTSAPGSRPPVPSAEPRLVAHPSDDARVLQGSSAGTSRLPDRRASIGPHASKASSAPEALPTTQVYSAQAAFESWKRQRNAGKQSTAVEEAAPHADAPARPPAVKTPAVKTPTVRFGAPARPPSAPSVPVGANASERLGVVREAPPLPHDGTPLARTALVRLRPVEPTPAAELAQQTPELDVGGVVADTLRASDLASATRGLHAAPAKAQTPPQADARQTTFDEAAPAASARNAAQALVQILAYKPTTTPTERLHALEALDASSLRQSDQIRRLRELAQCYAACQRPDDTRATLEMLTRLAPLDPWPCVELAKLLGTTLHDEAAALRWADQALTMAPWHNEARLLSARLRAKTGLH